MKPPHCDVHPDRYASVTWHEQDPKGKWIEVSMCGECADMCLMCFYCNTRTVRIADGICDLCGENQAETIFELSNSNKIQARKMRIIPKEDVDDSL